MVRVLVVDDSPTARGLLVEILRSDADLEVVAEAVNGREAIEMTKLHQPDVVTMDLQMPVMDGFEATRAIMAERPTPIVVVTASTSTRDVETSMRALRLGALNVLAKPVGLNAPDFDETCRHLVQTVKLMAAVKVVRRREQVVENGNVKPRPRLRRRVVVIAASTGGPAALSRILGALRPDFPLPVLVAQHLSPGFVDGFASWLDSMSPLRVRVARDGDPIEPGTVLVAPDDGHMLVGERGLVTISRRAPVDGFRPSATLLFSSAAGAFGERTVAVILTGMGRDGVGGLNAVRAAGGLVAVQDEASSVVFGMPGAAVAAGLAHDVLTLNAIAPYLEEIAAP